MPFTHCLLQKEKNPQLSFESCKILTRGLMEAYHLLSVRYMQLILLSLFKGTLPLDFPQEYYKVDTMCFLIFRKRNRDWDKKLLTQGWKWCSSSGKRLLPLSGHTASITRRPEKGLKKDLTANRIIHFPKKIFTCWMLKTTVCASPDGKPELRPGTAAGMDPCILKGKLILAFCVQRASNGYRNAGNDVQNQVESWNDRACHFKVTPENRKIWLFGFFGRTEFWRLRRGLL